MKSYILSITTFITLFYFNSIGQTVLTKKTLPDTLVVLSIKDEMTEKTTYMPSQKIVCVTPDKSKGFIVSVFIDENLYIKDLQVVMIKIGNCVENNEMIILFEDDSKISLTSWNKFNCDGDAWFEIGVKEREQLALKKIKKIRLTNGRSFESYTADVAKNRKEYFIKLFRNIEAEKVFEYKTK